VEGFYMKKMSALILLMVLIAGIAKAQYGWSVKNGVVYLTTPANTLKFGTHTTISPNGTITNPTIDSLRQNIVNQPAHTLYVSSAYSGYTNPYYTTIQAAINAASVGDVIMVGSGVYTAGFICNKQGISIIGESAPEYNDYITKYLIGGVIIQLTGSDYCGATEASFVMKNIGFQRMDKGECWISTGGSNNYHTYENIVCLGYDYNDLYHCFLHEMGHNVQISNIKTYLNAHGVAILSSYVTIDGLYGEDNYYDNLIIKSKEGGEITDVTATNIIGKSTSSTPVIHNNGIRIQCVNAGSSLSRVNIANASINGANVAGVYIDNDTIGTVSDVNILNVTVKSAVQYGFRIVADIASIDKINFVNCIGTNCTPNDFYNYNSAATNVRATNCQGTFLGAIYQTDLLPANTLYVSPTYTTMPAPFYTTINAALTAATTGSVIKVSAGTYTKGFTCDKQGVSIVGDAMPEYNVSTEKLIGGVIIQLTGSTTLCGASSADFSMKNIGIERVDPGECWNSSGGLNNNHSYENIICVGYAYNNAYHCFLHEKGYGVDIKNLKTFKNTFGLSILSSNVTVNGFYAKDHYFADIIIKSKEGGSIHDITITNFIGYGSPATNYNNGIVLESTLSGSSLSRVTLANGTIHNANIAAVSTSASTESAGISNVTIVNVIADSGAQGGFLFVSGNQISITNCQATNCLVQGFKNIGATNVCLTNPQGNSNGNMGANIYGDFSGLFYNQSPNCIEGTVIGSVTNATTTVVFSITGPTTVGNKGGGSYACIIEGLVANYAQANEGACGGIAIGGAFTHSILSTGAAGGVSAVTSLFNTASSNSNSGTKRTVTSANNIISVTQATNKATVSAFITRDGDIDNLLVYWRVKIIYSDMRAAPTISIP
jgi:hypothetical protein